LVGGAYDASPVPSNQQCCSFSAANCWSTEMAWERGVNKESAGPLWMRQKKEAIGLKGENRQVTGQE